MIPFSHLFDQPTLTALMDHDPLVQEYRALFSLLDWSLVEAWQQQRSTRGRPPVHPESAFLKAFLLRIRQKLSYTTELRAFLLAHPLLIVECGFQLVLDPTFPYGFDPQLTLPTRFWLSEKLRDLDPELLQSLLQATVTNLIQEIPGLGEVVAFDVKHIYAWVQQNNFRVSLPQRFKKDQILPGDPDCKLGVKRSTNQEQPDGTITEKKEMLWGYGSGVAAATTPDYGDIVLAEFTQPFNRGDATYFTPLYHQASIALQAFPKHLTADAAFDAWYVYDAAARHHGIAAVPLTQPKHAANRASDGTPICEKGLPMHPSFFFQHTHGYQARRFQCPLLFPTLTGQVCPHLPRNRGEGCRKDPNQELGGLMRVLLDRSGPLYHAVYTQRTSCERINSQAKELGIERPKVRNARSVANLNTLIYVIINLRALSRAKSINKGLLQMN